LFFRPTEIGNYILKVKALYGDTTYLLDISADQRP